ncbi:hypothetical protein QUF99_06645 [Bacillus sp. DX4.1]|uniref:hypothetical protein n=1 Tax=Bacillus sp. DX4.1 TaxID=3055867 RepID=UPI0025A30FE5|nr:hypothetical protein [Bacillus sp. DX4.1]MDM5187030.1 hypothetical protein [Bacillus sp. DX4.1]
MIMNQKEGRNMVLSNLLLLILGSLAGYILSLTGLSIGWLLGSLCVTGLLAYLRPLWIKDLDKNPKQQKVLLSFQHKSRDYRNLYFLYFYEET